jgi:hypothetical protein
MSNHTYDAQDRVTVYYDAGAPGPSVLAGRMIYPGERRAVTYAAYRKVAANLHFKLLDERGDVVDAPGAAINNEEAGTETAGTQSVPADTAPPAQTETEGTAGDGADAETDAKGTAAIEGQALKSPASMTVDAAKAYATTLGLADLVAFRDAEAESKKPRSSLLGPLDDMIANPEEENDG